MMRKRYIFIARRAGLLLSTMALTTGWYAQAQVPQASSADTAPAGYAVAVEPQKIPGVVVIGNPLDARDVVAPVSVLSGVDLLMKKAGTLGETVNSLPGVSSTFFGPNASRPTIRGLDGDRIRILNNLGASLDASSLSYDHNPSIDPLVIERIEVLRGPAALLYGGTAIGGVVNIVDNRIPREAVIGAGGSLETRYGGAEQERGTSVVLEAGNGDKNRVGGFSIHADAFKRETDNYKVPSGTRLTNPIINSAAESNGGALGASYVFANGSIGIAQSRYQAIYGTVAEEAVKIDMRQNRTAFEANLNQLSGLAESVFLKISRSDYQHVELENGAVGTIFKNNGTDFRLEAKHAKFGNLQGVIGVQGEQFNFSALGEEAFVPSTKTSNSALFIYEELLAGALKYSFGARVERSKVQSGGGVGVGAEAGAARFGEATQKTFNLASGSLGAQWKINDVFTFTSNFSLAERAPTFYELYANGAHIATAAYEVGSTSQTKERSAAIDLALRWKHGVRSVKVGVFAQNFRNYIALNRTGIQRDTEANGGGTISVTDCGNGTSVESGCVANILPEFLFQGVKARFSGFELEGTWRLVDKPYTLDWETKADYVRAEDRTHNQPLPRITPSRLTTGLVYADGGFAVRGDIQHVGRQKRVPAIDSIGETAGYTMINASVSYGFRLSAGVGGTIFLRGTNLTDRLAFSAASIDTIRALAPYPGRSIRAGVQVNF